MASSISYCSVHVLLNTAHKVHGRHASEPLSSHFSWHISQCSFLCSMDYCSNCWPYPLFYSSSVLGNRMSEELAFWLKSLESELFGLMIIIFAYFFPLNWNFFKKLFVCCIFFTGSASSRRFSIFLHGNNVGVCLCLGWSSWNNQSLTFFHTNIDWKMLVV